MFAYGYVQYNIGVVEFMQNTHLFIQLIWIGVYVWICEGISVCVEQCFQTSNLNNCGIVVNMEWELRIGCMRRKFNPFENLQYLNGISDLQKRSKTFFCINFGWCSCLELHAMHQYAILPLKLNRKKNKITILFFPICSYFLHDLSKIHVGIFPSKRCRG